MIDADIIDGLPSERRTQVREAIGFLAVSGILEVQRQRGLAQLAEGADDEDIDSLVEKIRVFRHRSHELLSLQQLGDTFNAEKDDD